MKTITIQNLHPKIPIPAPTIRAAVEKILKIEKISRATIAIIFVSDQKMLALNRRFLKHAYYTDVLTFPYEESSATRPGAIAGDIVISAPFARRQARVEGVTFVRELTLYVAHGILHLLGYDDHVEAELRRMRAAENRLLKKIFPAP